MTGPTQTIRCEECGGRGYVYLDIKVNDFVETETCDLCNGTGREPSDITARNHVEGHAAREQETERT